MVNQTDAFNRHLMEFKVWAIYKELFPTGIPQAEVDFHLCEVNDVEYRVIATRNGDLTFSVFAYAKGKPPVEVHTFTRN